MATSRSRPSNSWLPATNDDRLRPAGEALEAEPAAVDVAGKDQQLGAGRRLRVVLFGLEMQVGQQLQAHLSRAASGGPVADCLNLRPLPHGHGSLRPTLGAPRRTVSTW